MKIIAPGDPNTMIVDAANMLRTAGKNPYLGDPRQMRGIKAADGSGSDDENFLHQLVIRGS